MVQSNKPQMTEDKIAATKIKCDKQYVKAPSMVGSYMDEGTSHIRIGLFPAVVSGDYLASPSCSMLHSLIARACPMSDDTGLY